jgi:iron complex outermembrane receptor protein
MKSLVFRKWGNKKYSVFQSLKKVVNIAFLPLVYVFIFNSSSLAQTDTIKIEEVIINKTRIPALYSEIARVVTVIQKDEIENSSVKSLEELLELASNIDVRQRGVFGTQADISIRGGSFDQTLILINGIKINDPQTGHHSLNLPIDIENIERIEILEGPGARIYGQNAFAGAINFITTQNYNDRISASFTGGQNNLLSGTISTAFKMGKANNYLSVTKKICNGYIENTDFDILNIFYQGNVNTGFAIFSVQAGITDKKFGANNFYTPKYPDQYEITNTTFASARAEIGNIFKIIPSVYWRRNSDIFQLFRESENWYQYHDKYYTRNADTAKYYQNIYESWNYYSGHNYHLTNIFGAEINSNFNTKLGKTAMGIEYRSEEILSNKLGEKVDSIDIPFTTNHFFTYGHKRENASIYIDHFKSFSKFSFSTGVLINWNSDFKWNYYSGLDLSYSINDYLKIIGSANQSMRMPTFTDLYYQGPTIIGNPNLKPEKAITYETGLKFLSTKVLVNLIAFRRDGKNIIDWVKLENEDKWESLNYTNITTYGIEFQSKINFNKIVNEIFFIKYVNFSYSYIYSDKKSDEYISNYALDYLIHSATLTIFHKIYKNFGASWSYSYQDRNGTFSKYLPESGLTQETEYKPVNLLNGKLFWKNGFCEIFTGASNILNHKYYDLGNIEMPGIWITGGLNINLNFKEE